MAKFNYFSVSFSDPRKNDQIVKGQTYKTVAKRFWGDNLKFNVMHENKEMGIIDVQILKKYADGRYYLKGRISNYDPDHDRKYAEYQDWMKDLKRKYKKAGGRKNFGRY